MARHHVQSGPDTPENAVQRSALLERAAEFYHKSMTESEEARHYLRAKGINDNRLIESFRMGYGNGRLAAALPKRGPIRRELVKAGILTTDGSEHLHECIVLPVTDTEGVVVALCGIHVPSSQEMTLPPRPIGIWHIIAAKLHSEIVLAACLLDGLSLQQAGYANSCAVFGRDLDKPSVEMLREFGLQRIVLAGNQQRIEPLAQALTGFDVRVIGFPGNETVNSYLRAHGPERIVEHIDNAAKHAPGTSGNRAENVRYVQDGFVTSFGRRTYELRGIDKSSRRLKATLRTEHTGRLHIDTVDFYSAKARRVTCADLAVLFQEPAEVINADMMRLLALCEGYDREKSQAPAITDTPKISAKEREQAEAFGSGPDLIERILADFETCGLVGEEANKLLCYVAAVSRKTQDPLSVLILSSSGAGKTALQDATLRFCPPEDVVKLTSLTGKALFYKGRNSLKHKVLALEEQEGVDDAAYAIRSLISSGMLITESTVKDLATGKLTTQETRVEGPTAVFFTTTDPNTDPETKSRFFVTSVDESREQTRRILAFQRQRDAENEAEDRARIDATIRCHRNFQRLLKPLPLVNRYAGRLAYGDDRLQGRRDQPKYLNLIKAVAFLRQMIKSSEAEGCIRVDLADIRIANRLACDVLGRSLDELTGPGRALLMLLDRMVDSMASELQRHDPDFCPNRTRITFTRRQVREFTGWSNFRVHVHIKELVDMEYVLIESRGGARHGRLYRLAYEGQGKDGSKFLMGLTDPGELDEGMCDHSRR